MLRSDPTTPTKRNWLITRSIDQLYRLILPLSAHTPLLDHQLNHTCRLSRQSALLSSWSIAKAWQGSNSSSCVRNCFFSTSSNVLWCYCCFNKASNTIFAFPTSLYSVVIEEGTLRDWDNVQLSVWRYKRPEKLSTCSAYVSFSARITRWYVSILIFLISLDCRFFASFLEIVHSCS